MKIAFFISSIGDTDLALSTIQACTEKTHEAILISLAKTAQQRVASFVSPQLIDKKTLNDILGLSPEIALDRPCTDPELERFSAYLHDREIDQAFFGVPSVNNALPFQIANQLSDIPLLIAYEFMFKPDSHCIWDYVPKLAHKDNVHWALPLSDAKVDFEVDERKLHVIGHLSIDQAVLPKLADFKKIETIKSSLSIPAEQTLAFISSTTQPVEVDISFLEQVLAELPNHPNIQLRLGLHPGIQDFDTYLMQIIALTRSYRALHQFKIILPDSIISRLKHPELTIEHPDAASLFLRANISGAEAAAAADRVGQAVPGALLNQAALEGKPVYTHTGKPYLPHRFFSDNLSTFFSEPRKPQRSKAELGLTEKTAPQLALEVLDLTAMRTT